MPARSAFRLLVLCTATAFACLLPSVATAQTVVSLTYDDGIGTQMQTRALLKSHNMHGTFHINSGNVGTDPYYMSWSDVDALNADGNEIAGHTVDHQRLTNLTAAQQRHEICDDAATLRSHGYTVNTFAYPYGAGSTSTTVRQALVDCGYLSGRKFGDLRSAGCTDNSCPLSESIPPADPYGIRTPEWQPDEYTVTELESYVTQAEASGGGWVPLVFHDICNSCADSSVSLATFSALLDWLQPRAANGTVVKTVREVIAPAGPSTDLQLSMTDSPDPVQVGSNITYTLKVHNNGPDSASAVTLSDTLPSGLSLVSASSTKGSCSGTTSLSCNIGTVNAGTANDVTVTIVATAGASAAPSVTNAATASTSTSDTNPANNQATAQTTVNPAADLSVTKTDSPDPVQAGNNLTYTLLVHNNGPSTASAATLSDPLPPGLTLVSASSTKGTCSGTTTVSCSIGTVNAGAPNDVTVTIVATAGAGAAPSITNTATVSSTTSDPSAANNQASAATTVNPAADLSVTKSDAPDPAQAGGNLTYTMVVHNNGPSAAAGVTLTDPLPAGLTLVSATSTSGTCLGTTTVTCTIGTVNAGAANDVTVTIVAAAGAAAVPNVTNTATVSSTTTDPSAANNQASAQTTVNPAADLSVTKTDTPDPVQAGSNITYTLTVHNAGPSTATGVTLTDSLPAGITLVSAGSTKGACLGTTTVTCNIGTIDPGAANDVTVTIVASTDVNAVPGVSNTATVSSSTADPNGSNNQASAQTTVDPVADVSLSKSDSPDPVQTGEHLTYTLTVRNAGPSAAQSVSVSDPLPADVTLVSSNASQGTCSGTTTTVSCNLGTIAAGAANDATVTIVVTPDATAVPGITNTATVSSTTADPNGANNEAGAHTDVHLPPSADLQLSQTDSPDPVQSGDHLTYTFTVHNAGPDAADSVSLSDPLPGGVSLVSAGASQGNCSGTATVSCDLGTIAPGTANDATVTIDVTLDASAIPAITNTATVSTATADPDTQNNQAGAETTVQPPPSADLQLTKTDGPDPVQRGDHLTYTLTVHNAGPDAAHSVSLSDPLPSGVTLASTNASQGTCSGTTTASCDLGTIAAGAANDATVTIVVTPGPDAVPSITNTATVSAATADPDTQNNRASAETTVQPPPSADLQLTKTASPDPVQSGDQLTYTLTVHNAGPDDAHAVNLSDPLPGDVTQVSATSSQGTCSGTATVACDLGTTAAGSANDVVVTIVVTPGADAVPSITNTATVSTVTPDPDSQNDQASAGTTVNTPPPPPGSYIRPRGATPTRVSLVPAYDRCVTGNSTHLAPLSADSCSPPRLSSGQLTIGTPDANGQSANSIGRVVLSVIPGNAATTADEADVNVVVSMTDVRKATDLADYEGELQAKALVRLTDRLNGPVGDQTGTVDDFNLDVTVPCTATEDAAVGGTCSVITTANALEPGMVPERARSIWELGQITVMDGGPDGLASTNDNSPFAVQGVFIP